MMKARLRSEKSMPKLADAMASMSDVNKIRCASHAVAVFGVCFACCGVADCVGRRVEQEIAKMLELDVDGNGAIDFVEFVAGRASSLMAHRKRQ